MVACEKIRFPRQAAKVTSKPKFLVTEVNEDGPVKSQKTIFYVIPAKAGIQYLQIVKDLLDSGFRRSDDFLRDNQ